LNARDLRTAEREDYQLQRNRQFDETAMVRDVRNPLWQLFIPYWPPANNMGNMANLRVDRSQKLNQPALCWSALDQVIRAA
jgi:hypothetical protein